MGSGRLMRHAREKRLVDTVIDLRSGASSCSIQVEGKLNGGVIYVG